MPRFKEELLDIIIKSSKIKQCFFDLLLCWQDERGMDAGAVLRLKSPQFNGGVLCCDI
jgi:hypothetical protein